MIDIKGGFQMNTKDFMQKFLKIAQETVPSLAGQGLFRAGNELLRDAIKIVPRAPFREGHLRGSARTQGAGQAMHQLTSGQKKAFRAHKTDAGIWVLVGFNIEYAARWHEIDQMYSIWVKWTLPGSGRKYLESKMAMFKDKYMKIAADFITPRNTAMIE